MLTFNILGLPDLVDAVDEYALSCIQFDTSFMNNALHCVSINTTVNSTEQKTKEVITFNVIIDITIPNNMATPADIFDSTPYGLNYSFCVQKFPPP